MINLILKVENPWSDRWNILWNKNGSFSKHKAWEFNGYETNQIINLNFNIRPNGDHAGVRIMLGLFGYEVELHLYDIRHWDYEKNTWATL